MLEFLEIVVRYEQVQSCKTCKKMLLRFSVSFTFPVVIFISCCLTSESYFSFGTLTDAHLKVVNDANAKVKPSHIDLRLQSCPVYFVPHTLTWLMTWHCRFSAPATSGGWQLRSSTSSFTLKVQCIFLPWNLLQVPSVKLSSRSK